MRLRRTAFLAGAAALGIAPTLARPAAADPVVVRVGIIPADIGAVVVYARELGYFKNAGLDVQIQTMQSGPSIAPAVIGGSLDVGAMNAGSLAGARERGLPLRYFAPAALAPPDTLTDVMLVRSDSAIHTGADMNGKIVGIVAVKTLEQAAMLLWVDKHGGDSKTLKFTEVPYPEMAAALEAGRIDIALPSEPFASQARGPNRIVAGVFSAMPATFIAYGFFSTDAWLAANADTATKFVSALRQAAVWANAHEKDSALLLAQFTKMDPKVAATMARITYATTLDPALIQPAIDVMVRYNMLPQTIDAGELIWRPAKSS